MTDLEATLAALATLVALATLATLATPAATQQTAPPTPACRVKSNDLDLPGAWGQEDLN